jgi:hypothetical protein
MTDSDVKPDLRRACGMSDEVFVSVDDSSVLLWSGNPDCQAAHAAILNFLSKNCTPFINSPKTDDHILRGNLGETITFCLGRWQVFGTDCLGHFANALRPFSGKSNPELDLLWVYFGASPKDDWAALQEVKTTGANTIAYASNLIDDYDKLFATNPRLTLHTRIQDFKNRLQYEQNRPDAILDRVTRLFAVSPKTSTKIRLLPTVVHDRTAQDVVSTMLAIRDTLINREWSNVESWAINLSQLDQRLMRLAGGKA